MITLPSLPKHRTVRESETVFLGLDRTPLAPPASFSDAENLSARAYPHLAPRLRRGTYATPASPTALLAREELCYTDGGSFVIGDRRIPMGLSADGKQLVSFGEYGIILPDRKYVRPSDGVWGEIDAEATSPAGARATLTLCRADGSPHPTEPATNPAASPTGGELWLDTTALTPVLYRFAPETERWTPVAETYLRLHARGIGAPFEVGDSVTLSGLTPPALRPLNATHTVAARGEDYLVFRGILPHAFAQTGPITAARRMPRLDRLIASGGRLWGCFRGRGEDGSPRCEIRASRRGDFRNWEGGEGENAAFAAEAPVHAPFTAAFDYLGTPHFFTEDCIVRVTGDRPAAYRVRTVPAEGVEAGSGRSLALIGDTLLYLSPAAVCAYRGGLPTRLSAPLGGLRLKNAAAGALGALYYLSAQDADTLAPHLFTYDTARAIWHREDSTRAPAFAPLRGDLCFIDADTAAIRTVNGSGTPDSEAVRWMAQTQVIAANPPDRCRLARIDLRLSLPKNSCLDCYVEYNSDGEWHHLHTLRPSSLSSHSPLSSLELPIRPLPCDHLRLRLVGSGNVQITAITKTRIVG